MVLREWLLDSSRGLWTVVLVPTLLLSVLLTVGIWLSHKKGGRWVLRSAWWEIPAMIAFILYYGWLFESSVFAVVRYVVIGVVGCAVWIVALDSIRPDSPLILRLFGSTGAEPKGNPEEPGYEGAPDEPDRGEHDGQVPSV